MNRGSVGSEQRVLTAEADGKLTSQVIEQQISGRLLPAAKKVTLVRQQILRDEVRKEIVARRVERASEVRDRIHELYYRQNHPFTYWWHSMWTNK